MEKPKISVVIPIFNTGIYLEETLMSLVNQTMIDDIEVLMIDDGSTDESRYIIEKFAFDYDNFHAVHKENEGQGIARNYGLLLAKGEYVHFMDSDDFIVPNAYEKLYNLAISGDYDFVVGNVMKFSNYNCWDDILFRHSFEGLNQNQAFTSVNDHPSLLWDSSAANKLYKKEFLIENNINFINKKIFFEDILFAFESYIKADSFCFIDYYFYFWRVRKNLSSVTQQNKSFRNFSDRLEIIQLMKDLIPVSGLNDDSLDTLYHKWLFHDLKMFLKTIDEIPSKHHGELIDKVSEIIEDIPMSIREKLPSYHQVIYKMIDNDDIDGLVYFAPLDKQLRDSDFDFKIDDVYKSLIDFDRDVVNEDLTAKATDIKADNKNLLIDFDFKINYLSDSSPKFSAFLIGEGEDELDVKDGQIILPFDLIRNRKSSRILVEYIGEGFTKKAYLRNNDRSSILLDNLDIEIGIGLNRMLYINVREMSRDKVIVEDIAFDDGDFIFECSGIDEVSMENVVTFERRSYKLKDGKFKIPYSHLIKTPIKKWELKADKLLQLNHTFNFYQNYDEIAISNKRNIILINDSIYDKFEKLNKLNEKNSKLKRENKELKKTIKEFKSKKIVKFANKFNL